MNPAENIETYLEYINDPFAKGWIQRGRADRDGVNVSFVYMDLCDGNPYDAMLLSQILFWFEINEAKLKPRAQYVRGNHLWVVKSFDEWAESLHFKSSNTIRNAMNRLRDKNLIVLERHKSPFHKSQVVAHVRPNWKVFGEAINTPGSTLKVEPEPPGEVEPEPTAKVDSEETLKVEPSSDTTTDTTPEITTEKKDTAPADAGGDLSKEEEPGITHRQKTDLIKAWWDALPELNRPIRPKPPAVYKAKPFLEDAEEAIRRGMTPEKMTYYVKGVTYQGQYWHNKVLRFGKACENAPGWCVGNYRPPTQTITQDEKFEMPTLDDLPPAAREAMEKFLAQNERLVHGPWLVEGAQA